MPRLPNQRDRDFAANLTDDKTPADIAELFSCPPLATDELFIPADIAKLFSCPPLAMDELFEDPIVRMKIGMLITRAMDNPPSPRRGVKSR
jgi:hypothetical protein